MIVDMEPWPGGMRGSQEQQDGGRQRCLSLTISHGQQGPGLNPAPQNPASIELIGGTRDQHWVVWDLEGEMSLWLSCLSQHLSQQLCILASLTLPLPTILMFPAQIVPAGTHRWAAMTEGTI